MVLFALPRSLPHTSAGAPAPRPRRNAESLTPPHLRLGLHARPVAGGFGRCGQEPQDAARERQVVMAGDQGQGEPEPAAEQHARRLASSTRGSRQLRRQHKQPAQARALKQQQRAAAHSSAPAAHLRAQEARTRCRARRSGGSQTPGPRARPPAQLRSRAAGSSEGAPLQHQRAAP